MPAFPLLSSGAVSQYPLGMGVSQASAVLRFLDGSDQRFSVRGKPLRRWHVQVNLLSDAEIEALEEFFAGQNGDYTPFSFPDPLSGQLVPNCRIGDARFLSQYVAAGAASASFWVVECHA